MYNDEIENMNHKSVEQRPESAGKGASQVLETAKPMADQVAPFWTKYLERSGFRLPLADSFNPPYCKSDILVEFKPVLEQDVIVKSKVAKESKRKEKKAGCFRRRKKIFPN